MFEINEFPPVEDEYGDDGAELDVLNKQFRKCALFNAQDGGGKRHVPGGRDRKEFGDSLDNGEDDGLDNGH